MPTPQDICAEHLRLGSSLHQAGHAERALVEFEKALAAQPDDLHAANACATLLCELQRPKAALAILQNVRTLLWQDAQSVTNLGIVCEQCAMPEEALAAYEQALHLDPAHVRSLNNSALIAASLENWNQAIERLTRCTALEPHEAAWAVNLCDVLTGAHQHVQALTCIEQAWQRFAPRADIAVRRAVILAFNAQFDAAQTAFDQLPGNARQLLQDYLQQAQSLGGQAVGKALRTLPNVQELYLVQAFAALQDCHWAGQDVLVGTMRHLLAQSRQSQTHFDWRDAQFYALVLPLTEQEQTQFRIATARNNPAPNLPPLHPTPHPDGRIHVGLVTQSLHDARYRNALAAQLALHDATQFALHLYCPTPQPQQSFIQDMLPHAASITEIAHLDSQDTARRMRLDQLDVYMDCAFYTPWCRADLPYTRVAPIQIRSQSWQRVSLGFPYEYVIGDRITHPDALDKETYGAIVRLPHTCWLATNDDVANVLANATEHPLTRSDANLPQDALVLCAFLGSVAIDPTTFAAWMQILRALPDAVLWLPSFGPSARANLQRTAALEGVQAQRLVFAQRLPRAQQLANMTLADLFIDSLRFNANHGLVDALRMGVPALGCLGQHMASRLGGSIIAAAGLPECVHPDASSMVAHAISLGRDRKALRELRQRLTSQHAIAPLFAAKQRVQDWEVAWRIMVQRYRQGVPPASFDV